MNNLFAFLSRHYHWFLFALFEVISAILLFQNNGYQKSLLVSSSNVVAGKIYETSSQVEQFFSLTDVNEELTQRNVYLERQLEVLRSELARRGEDSALYESETVRKLEQFHITPAKVVSNSITTRDNLITIDKGEADGIKADMGVVCGTGVVGIIYQAGKHYSVVLPLLNSRSSVSCQIAGRGYFGHLSWPGKDSRYAYLEDIPRHAHFKLYDKVVTSGYSSVFPPGMLIGKIIHVYNSPDGISYRCMVELSVDFSRIHDVCVINDNRIKEQLNTLHAAQDSLSNDN